jgi:hypothetical protein
MANATRNTPIGIGLPRFLRTSFQTLADAATNPFDASLLNFDSAITTLCRSTG